MESELYPKRRQRDIGSYACVAPLAAGFGLAHFFSDAHSQLDVNVTTIGVALMFSGAVSTFIAKHAFDHEKNLKDIFRGKAVYAGLCAAALVGGTVGYGTASDNLLENRQLAVARLISADIPVTITARGLYCNYSNQGEEVLVKDNEWRDAKIRCPDKMP